MFEHGVIIPFTAVPQSTHSCISDLYCVSENRKFFSAKAPSYWCEVVVLVVMHDTDSQCVWVCVGARGVLLSPHGNWTCVDKPLLARAPTSDVNVMVWHIFVPRVQEFGL